MNTEKSFLHSLKWAYTGNWGEKAFSAVFTVILAAKLGPRDFGIASIAIIYISFFQMFLDQGLAAALIQRKSLDRKHLNAVFWMDILLAIVLIVMSSVLGRRWALVNHAPQVAPIIVALTFCILLESLSVVQTSILRREMDFKSLSIRTNASVVAGGVVGITLAFAGFGVWALVCQQLVRDFTALLLLWKLSPWRPALEFSSKHLKELLHFSIPNFVGQLAGFADGQGSSIALGVLFGPVAVGLYRVAERVVNSVLTMSMASIQSVAFPEFARLQEQPNQLRASILSCIRLSAVATLPALAGVLSLSRPLMNVIGAKWSVASDALRIMCLFGMVMSLTFFTGPLLQALAKTRQAAALEWARMTSGIVMLVVAGIVVRHSSVEFQINGIALSRFVAAVVFIAPVFITILLRVSNIRLSVLALSVAPSAAAALVVFVVVTVIDNSFAIRSIGPVAILAIEVLSGAVVGLGVLFLLEPRIRKIALALLRSCTRHGTTKVSLSETI